MKHHLLITPADIQQTETTEINISTSRYGQIRIYSGPRDGDLEVLMTEKQQTFLTENLNSISRTSNSSTFNRNWIRLERYIDSKPNTTSISPLEHTWSPLDYLADVWDIAVMKGNRCSLHTYIVQSKLKTAQERTQKINQAIFRKELDSSVNLMRLLRGQKK